MTIPAARRHPGLLLLAVVATVYLAHAACYGPWIVDDAGISFAYARNFAAGHGLVAQPGAAAVEGYSNPLWVLLLGAFFRLGLFDAVWTPKLMSAVLVLIGFARLWRTFARDQTRTTATAAALALTAANPCFVIWTISGLENGLLFALVAALLAVVERTFRIGASRRDGAVAALLAAGLALTRPDGAIWLAAWPLAMLLGRPANGERRAPALAGYGALAGSLLGAFLVHRYLTFGALLPNTWFAKQDDGAPIVRAILGVPLALAVARGMGQWLRRRCSHRSLIVPAVSVLVVSAVALLLLDVRSPLRAAFGDADLAFGAGLFALFALVRELSPATRTAMLGTGIGAMALFALPRDWMGYLRFGTALLPCLFLAITSLLEDAGFRLRSRRGLVLAAVTSVALVPYDLRRARSFFANPTFPFHRLADEHRATFERYRDILGEGAPTPPLQQSLATEDVGAPLFFGTLRIVDLGGLTDRRIGRVVFRQPALLCDYVFGEVRPTFLRLDSYIGRHGGLQDDPRFRSDYVAIRERLAPRENDGTGPLVAVGHYVRRDLVLGDRGEATLAAMRAPR